MPKTLAELTAKPVKFAPDADVMTYAEVRAKFGWKTDKSIRDAVNRGELERVLVNKGKNGYRITRESVFKRQLDLTEEEEARKEFGYSTSQWRQFIANKKLERERKLAAAERVAEPTYVNEFGDQFAPTKEWSEDPLTGQMTPPGTYRDETDTLICGIPSPKESRRAFIERCRRRGITPYKSLYVACLMDGAGKFRVNDVPKEKQSQPILEFTRPIGTMGGL